MESNMELGSTYLLLSFFWSSSLLDTIPKCNYQGYWRGSQVLQRDWLSSF